jgi:hypothetical protein
MADSVFGDLGGPGQQSGDGVMSQVPDPARNAYGIPTHNPSGSYPGHLAPPVPDSVFGDLGGGGVACQLEGGEVPALPVSRDPGGQGGY